MTAIYDFYKNPKQKDSTEKTRYHARVVTNQTISTDELARKIHTRCTVTTADVKAVLTSRSRVLKLKLPTKQGLSRFISNRLLSVRKYASRNN